MKEGFKRNSRNFLTEEELKNRPKVTIKLIKRVLSYLLPYWKQMLLVFIAIILASIFSLLPAIYTGRMVDEGLIGKNLDSLIKFILLAFLVTVVANLIKVLESYLNIWIAQHITYDMRNSMYAHLQAMPHSFFTSNNQGDIITRMTSDISQVQQIITNTLSSIISNVMTLIVALIAMYQKNWILATLGIIIVPLFVLPTKSVGKTRWSLTRETQALNDRINGILNETLSVSGQMLVKLFNREDTELANYQKANFALIKLKIKESMAGRWFRVVLSTFSSIGPMLIYLVGGLLLINYDQDLSVGDITVMVALLSRMYNPVNSLLNIQVDWIRSMALFTRLFAYYDMDPTIKNCDDAIILRQTEGRLEYDHVDFGYDQDKLVLHDINFKLNKGQNIASVGPSGAGKSTIASLIPRLYDVTNGRILLDGIDIRNINIASLRQQIGVVSQDTYLFNSTIRENLLYAKADASEEEMIDACKKASVHDFIINLPLGYDTIVGNRGLKLSGGEKQRLSIARVLLKDPKILIFDEATSSLDSIAENAIQSAISSLIKERTSIIIAHRLSTILSADEILVIKDGRIIERGKHEELLIKNNVYTELYQTQFKEALYQQ